MSIGGADESLALMPYRRKIIIRKQIFRDAFRKWGGML